MKNNLLLGLAIITMLFSCTTDDTPEIIINDNSVTNNNTGGGNGNGSETIFLSGTFTEDLTLEEDNNYVVDGPLIMASGTTLTIPAGLTIEALATGADVYIAISQGAQIIANGTASRPIILTSNSSAPQAGDWGGLILLGNAPINSVTGGSATSTSEIANLPYGGNIVDDTSGSLRYVRVQYSGGSADGQSENNGFSFYGVGNGTTVEFIQVFEGLDDGVEFFGGTVNVNNVSVINAQDDSIDWTEGYSGTIVDAHIRHGAEHDRAIEADGFNTDIGNNSNPLFFSNPTITNLTVEGQGSGSGNEAIRLRAGTQGTLTNIVLEGFPGGFRVDGDNANSPTGQAVLDGNLSVTDVTLTDVLNTVRVNTTTVFTEADLISGIGNGTGTDFATWGAGWAVQ
ncbi:multidrug transporter [Flavobacteriaceae bacterium AU392]|nr:multidrug transporter [Flavobacteriaceae bacterium]RKM84604.1 multidrug transporter [Flavobacteriaceae bacterium AU392]